MWVVSYAIELSVWSRSICPTIVDNLYRLYVHCKNKNGFLLKKSGRFACETCEAELHQIFPGSWSQMFVRQISNYISHVCNTVIKTQTYFTKQPCFIHRHVTGRFCVSHISQIWQIWDTDGPPPVSSFVEIRIFSVQCSLADIDCHSLCRTAR